MASQYFPKQVTDRTYSELMQPKTDYPRSTGDPHAQMNRHKNIRYFAQVFHKRKTVPDSQEMLEKTNPFESGGADTWLPSQTSLLL